MTIRSIALLCLVLAAILSNLPFLSQRWFGCFVLPSKHKTIFLALLEWLVSYVIWIALVTTVEEKIGEIHARDWSLWAVSIALFAVLAFPGVVARYLWLPGKH